MLISLDTSKFGFLRMTCFWTFSELNSVEDYGHWWFFLLKIMVAGGLHGDALNFQGSVLSKYASKYVVMIQPLHSS